MSRVLPVTLALLLGIGVGMLIQRARGSHEAALSSRDDPAGGGRVPSVSLQAPPPVRPPLIVASVEDVRSVIREEMAEVRSRAPAASPEARAKVDDGPEDAARFADAKAVVDGAVTKGSWTREDASRLQTFLPRLAADHRREIRLQLTRALNADLLRMEDPLTLP
jgi:hypothetical protein